MKQSAKPWSVAGRNFFVYTFHHVDFMRGLPPEQVYDLATDNLTSGPGTCEALLPAMRDLFTKAGWEGDGQLEVFQIPPFVTIDNDPDGFLVWHVKQSNNGTSWLASEKYLPDHESLAVVTEGSR
jgi:hypothetical protein